MRDTVAPVTSRRADLTFRHNAQRGRHGWLRLTPAYSLRLVEQILDASGPSARTVLDPFSGSGTTVLGAACRGWTALATDINPFLIWLARVKSDRYSKHDLEQCHQRSLEIVRQLRQGRRRAALPPPMRNIERWWNPSALSFLAALRDAIMATLERRPRALLQVAFCRTLMAVSSAAFNHQSLSFGSGPATSGSREDLRRMVGRFVDDVAVVLASGSENPSVRPRLWCRDARHLDRLPVEPQSVGLVLTSPPYPNRMSYVRELRPYLYWLGHLEDACQAGQLDWEAIGGTWGMATSRLSDWHPQSDEPRRLLGSTLERVHDAHPKNGPLMANYLGRYFEDMGTHLRSLRTLLSADARLHYIVGNSVFYGNLVSTERILARQLRAAGYQRISVTPVRKRNSKKELFEYHVQARV